MKMKNFLFSILCIFLCSCGGSNTKDNRRITAFDLEKKQATGVVLIKNTFYYSIDFDSNLTVYFTGVNNEGQIEGATFDESEIEPAISFGTGFFVSDDGIIATNSHVACPSFSTKDVRSAIVDAFSSLAEETQDIVNQLNERLGELRFLIDAGNTEYLDDYQKLAVERDNYQKFINLVNRLNASNCEFTRHCDIGIALNNTHVSNTSDFINCVTIADDPEHDLALIQLKGKETPKSAYVFKVDPRRRTRANNTEDDRNDSPRKSRKSMSGKTLFMIAFNLGPQLALTKEGIKAQITKGEVTQDTDEDHFMYSIPSLHGSSGAPVLDLSGRLIAVNFAGLDHTQSFNYGIKVIHLKNLLKEL